MIRTPQEVQGTTNNLFLQPHLTLTNGSKSKVVTSHSTLTQLELMRVIMPHISTTDVQIKIRPQFLEGNKTTVIIILTQLGQLNQFSSVQNEKGKKNLSNVGNQH